jgi:hypothetical protein
MVWPGRPLPIIAQYPVLKCYKVTLFIAIASAAGTQPTISLQALIQMPVGQAHHTEDAMAEPIFQKGNP